jgi:hypothetical protein
METSLPNTIQVIRQYSRVMLTFMMNDLRSGNRHSTHFPGIIVNAELHGVGGGIHGRLAVFFVQLGYKEVVQPVLGQVHRMRTFIGIPGAVAGKRRRRC